MRNAETTHTTGTKGLWRRMEAVVLRRPGILASLLLLKAAYMLGILAIVWLWPDFDTYEFEHAYQCWPREGGPIFTSHFATWDTAHYLYLSELGYHAGDRACAFYPLWPLLARWAAPLFGGSLLLTGLVLANACSLLAWALFHRLVARRWGRAAANWALAFLVTFPGSLFFQFHYTESLFLLLLMVLWWGLETDGRSRIWFAGWLLPLTRAIGVLTVLVITWHLLAKALRSSSTETPAGGRRFFCNIAEQPLWLVLAPLWGWSLYLALMWYWTGNPFEGFVAQKHWGVNSVGNLWNLPKLVVGFISPATWHEYQGSALDRGSFVLLLCCLPLMWRIDKPSLIWTYALGLVPAMSATFVSFTRYLSCAFPVFVMLGVGLGVREHRWSRCVLVAAFGTLHLVLLWRFVNFRWAG